jgi:hypothetical protein
LWTYTYRKMKRTRNFSCQIRTSYLWDGHPGSATNAILQTFQLNFRRVSK